MEGDYLGSLEVEIPVHISTADHHGNKSLYILALQITIFEPGVVVVRII
jgi:hypothetical protein